MYPSAVDNATIPIAFKSKTKLPFSIEVYNTVTIADKTERASPFKKSFASKLKKADFIKLFFWF